MQNHSLLYALLEAAVLASVPLRFGDLAVPVRHARVHPPVLHGPLEESFAAFARDNAVVQAGGLVLANHTNHRLLLLLPLFVLFTSRRLAKAHDLHLRRLAAVGVLRYGSSRGEVESLRLLAYWYLTQISCPKLFHVQRGAREVAGSGRLRRHHRSTRGKSQPILPQVEEHLSGAFFRIANVGAAARPVRGRRMNYLGFADGRGWRGAQRGLRPNHRPDSSSLSHDHCWCLPDRHAGAGPGHWTQGWFYVSVVDAGGRGKAAADQFRLHAVDSRMFQPELALRECWLLADDNPPRFGC